jgi:hypothetical protein
MVVVMRIVFTFLAAAFFSILLFSQEASARCVYGCNLIDDGSFNNSLIGRYVYTDGFSGGRVLENDYSSQIVLVSTNANGKRWFAARDLYTAKRMEERRVAQAAGAVIVLGCIFGGCGNQSSGSRSNSGSSSSRDTCINRCRNQTYSYDPRDQAAGEARCMKRC